MIQVSRIAIVGLACQYPEAESPTTLWRNVLAGRRSFREIPAGRVDLEDYYSADRTAPDLTYNRVAAVLEDYVFDRLAFHVPGAVYRSTDTAHWLALDVAKRALDDAQFESLPTDRRRVAVLVGNTLTGDRTRSNNLRLRWPYVRRAVVSALRRHGHTDVAPLLADLERTFKEPFPPICEESLAGGLSNTISGRICNYFDFGGGGYTIDGACSSSLLTVISACIGLQRNDIDFALAGGVDISIDPFELVGFAKTNALAEHLMRIYDQRSEGFWVGEGCGVLALCREETAAAWGLPVYASVTGFGVSSDGHGGITRPEVDGHILAMHRAYDAAGYGPDTVSLFEGHGTGTRVGDAAEVTAISTVRRAAGAATTAALGSIKANIGHTKAAAGAAGLIKAAMSLHTGVIPATTGCDNPLAELTAPDRVLDVPRTARSWPDAPPRRAAISSMGFGGINAHITLEHAGSQPTTTHRRWSAASTVAATAQDAELIVLAGDSLHELAVACRQLVDAAGDLTFGRMTDLAIICCRDTPPSRRARAAVVARSPRELRDGCADIVRLIAEGTTEYLGASHAFSTVTPPPRIGFLCSGQGAPVRTTAGAIGRRFGAAVDVVAAANLANIPTTDTALAQPAIVAASLAAIAALAEVGIEGAGAVGHSLGELTALQWGGAFDRDAVLDLARIRGDAMSRCVTAPGRMVELACDSATAQEIIDDLGLSIAAINAKDRTVVSGPQVATEAATRRAGIWGITATPLRVGHAFHSPLVAPAADAIRAWFDRTEPEPTALRRPVASTVTGQWYRSGAGCVRETLVEQITAPVRFTAGLETLASVSDLLVEVGPGRILADLAAASGRPTFAVDAGSESIGPFLSVVGVAFALGTPVKLDALARNRAALANDPLRQRSYLTNPCETLPKVDPLPGQPEPATVVARPDEAPGDTAGDSQADPGQPETDLLNVLRELIAAKSELPVEVITESSTFLVDLNLNSIAVAQIASDAAKAAGREPVAAPHELAEGTVGELVRSLEANPPVAERTAGSDASGVDDWVRPFTLQWVPTRLSGSRRAVNWQLSSGCPDAVRAVFGEARGAIDGLQGVVVPLNAIDNEADAHRAIRALAEVATRDDLARVAVVHAGGAAGLVRTLQVERPDLVVRLLDRSTVDGAVTDPQRRMLRQLCETGESFEEFRVDDDSGQVLTPRLVKEEPRDVGARPIGPGDVVLVSGGGKGIGAEAALCIGRDLGAQVAILGRSSGESDQELRSNLDRFRAHGIKVTYHQADVADPDAVSAAIKTIEANSGPVAGVLHAAGVNEPALLDALTQESISLTWRSKVAGLINILDALDPHQLRLLVAFGSLIGRSGMRGEAHYAVANERMRRIVEDFGTNHESCKTLTLDWAVWSGVGMGAKLGLLDAMNQFGIRPISPDDGIALMLRLIASDGATSPVVTGRFGSVEKTLPTRQVDLPFLRFLERPLVHYPGVELVVEATLAGDTDRYLAEHQLDGLMLFPSVAGIEAMAQVARGLTDGRSVTAITDVELIKPITVPPDGTTRIRLAGLVRLDGTVEVCIRSDETNFETVHFRAHYHFDVPANPVAATTRPASTLLPESGKLVAALYQDLLFHGPKFRRVTGFHVVHSSRCEARIDIGNPARWFVDYLPQTLVLGDLGARDACLHAAQVSIPDRRILPVRVAKIHLHRAPDSPQVTADSIELRRAEDTLVLDLTVDDGAGVIERWTGLELKVVEPLPHPPQWLPDLFAAYLERRLGHRWGWEGPTALRVAIVNTADRERRARSAAALAASGDTEQLQHRPDGQPELASGRHVSVSHHGPYTMLLVTGRAPVGVDLEAVQARPTDAWSGMLGEPLFGLAARLASAADESLDRAATRVWSAVECLRKLGVLRVTHLDIGHRNDEWIRLKHGPIAVDTTCARLAGLDTEVIAAAARGASPESQRP